ncbi:MAG: hypothetical protein ACT4QF_08185 [Sporichthyaceae bacterium]
MPRIAAAVVAGTALTVFLPLAPAHAADPTVEEQLATVRKATEKFKDPAAAVAAGYEATDVCVAGPMGVMGFHYVNHELMKNGHTDIAKPPIMVYQLQSDGSRALAAVEWFRPDDDQDLTTSPDRPSLFNHPFDGPMEGHEPGMPRHYDLHAWLFADNPNGVLAPWNSKGTCGKYAAPPPAAAPAAAKAAAGDPSHATHTAAPTAAGSSAPGESAPMPVGGAATGLGTTAESDGGMWFGLGGVAAVFGALMIALGWRRRRAG